jgi:hypothetical protein
LNKISKLLGVLRVLEQYFISNNALSKLYDSLNGQKHYLEFQLIKEMTGQNVINPYSFVNNDAINSVDLLGLDTLTLDVVITILEIIRGLGPWTWCGCGRYEGNEDTIPKDVQTAKEIIDVIDAASTKDTRESQLKAAEKGFPVTPPSSGANPATGVGNFLSATDASYKSAETKAKEDQKTKELHESFEAISRD